VAGRTANRGPVTSFESRTCTVSGHVATSTQSSPCNPLWLDLCQDRATSTHESPSEPL
jgi:hypothetical protein